MGNSFSVDEGLGWRFETYNPLLLQKNECNIVITMSPSAGVL